MKLTKEKLFEILDKPRLYKNNNIQANCPWCGHNEFYISLNDNHLWQCFRKKKCEADAGNIYKLLEKLNRTDIYDIKQTVIWSPKLSNDLIGNLHVKNDSIDLTLDEISLPIGFKRVLDDNYLNKRGFVYRDYYEYTIGITKLDAKLINYIIFVIKQDFKNVAYIARYKGTKEECDKLNKIRYRNSDSDFVKILGGYDELLINHTKTVILVEGLFDKKNVDNLLNLKNNNEIKCCFTFKCNVSKEQILKLKNKKIENIILLYDSDVVQKIKQTSFELLNHFNVKIALSEFLNEKKELKDPAELNFEELTFILNNTYNAINFYTSKL